MIGDWDGHAQVPDCTPVDCAASFNAGVDMTMAPSSWKGFYESLLGHVQAGRVSEARLDEAVRRIVRVKLRMGLFEEPAPSERSLGGDLNVLGSADHRSLARRAVGESLVRSKNNDRVLPIDPTGSVLVAGSAADAMTLQTGGWTLTWQGDGTENEDFPTGQTIWEGLREQIEAGGGTAVLSPDGEVPERPDVAIDRLNAAGIPVVSVLLSGRPRWVSPAINDSDAVVAAWLPGSEGGGVAEVLLANSDGTLQLELTGRLPYAWPGDAATTRHADAAFPLGYGFNYAGDRDLPALFE